MKNSHFSELIARYVIYGLFAALLLVTVVTGHEGRTMTMNYAFLAIMFVLVLIFNRLGIRRLQILTEDLEAAEAVISKKTGFQTLPSRAGVKFRIDSVDGDWKRFVKDWENRSGMDCDLEEYINEQELLEVTHAGLCSLVPGFLTSLGILGTFVGLVTGLGGIDFADYDVMTRSVEGLVGGLYVAFYTSIYGISLSIAFNFAFRYFSSGLSVKLDRFYDVFHEKYQAVTQKSMMDEMTRNQKRELAGIETSAAYLEKVHEQLSSGLGKELGSQISENMIPEFRKIDLSLQGAMEEFRQAQENALGTIVDEFVSEMQGLMQEPIEAMSRSMAEHVEKLGGSVAGLSASQGEMTTKLGELIARIEQTSTNTEEVNKSSAKIIEQLNAYVEKLDSTSEASARMVENMNTQTASLMEKLDQYSQNMNEVAQEQKTVLTDLRTHEERLNQTFAGLEENQSRLSGNIVSFSESAAELAKRQADPINLSGVEQIMKSYTERAAVSRDAERRQLDNALRGMITSAGETQRQYADQMAMLQKSFEKMEEYQENIRDFTGRLAAAASSRNNTGVPGAAGSQDGKESSEVAKLMAGQQEMTESLKRCIALLEAEQERRSRPFLERAADFFRGSRQ